MIISFWNIALMIIFNYSNINGLFLIFIGMTKRPKSKSKSIFVNFYSSFNRYIMKFNNKKYIEISTNDFANIFAGEIVTQIVVWLGWYWFIKQTFKNKKITKFKFSYGLIIFFWIITQFYVHKELSLFLIVAILNLRFIIYLMFDYFNWELELNRKKIIWIVLWILWAIVLWISQFM